MFRKRKRRFLHTCPGRNVEAPFSLGVLASIRDVLVKCTSHKRTCHCSFTFLGWGSVVEIKVAKKNTKDKKKTHKNSPLSKTRSDC